MSGFTLLEMAVVLALVALMSLIIIEALRFGERAYAEVVNLNDTDWNIFVAQRFLRGTLESVRPFSPGRASGAAYGLDGTAKHLSFSASTARIRGPGDLDRYDIFLATDSANARRQNLLVSWHIDRDGRPGAESHDEHREVLLENVTGLNWSYLDISCGAPGDWRESWQGRHDLPALIRARVVFPDGDSRQWPDLLVAPRVTDDSFFLLPDSDTEQPLCRKSG